MVPPADPAWDVPCDWPIVIIDWPSSLVGAGLRPRGRRVPRWRGHAECLGHPRVGRVRFRLPGRGLPAPHRRAAGSSGGPQGSTGQASGPFARGRNELPGPPCSDVYVPILRHADAGGPPPDAFDCVARELRINPGDAWQELVRFVSANRGRMDWDRNRYVNGDVQRAVLDACDSAGPVVDRLAGRVRQGQMSLAEAISAPRRPCCSRGVALWSPRLGSGISAPPPATLPSPARLPSPHPRHPADHASAAASAASPCPHRGRATRPGPGSGSGTAHAAAAPAPTLGAAPARRWRPPGPPATALSSH